MTTQFITTNILEIDGRVYHEITPAKVKKVPQAPVYLECFWCKSGNVKVTLEIMQYSLDGDGQRHWLTCRCYDCSNASVYKYELTPEGEPNA